MITKKYTLAEVARCLGRTVRTMRSWLQNGKLKAEKSDTGYRWLIAQSELDRLMGEVPNDANKD